MQQFEKENKNSSSGVQVFKRVRTKLPPIRKSLAILLVSLQGTNVVIELKNDAEVTGILEDTDQEMNVTISNATQVSSDGTSISQDSITVKGHSIRYVHIPRNMKMRLHLADYIRKIDRIKSSNQPHSIKDKPKPIPSDSSVRQDIILTKDT